MLVISITPQRAASWQTTATALADKLQALLSQGNFVDFFLSYDIILRSFTVLVSERADLAINPDAFPVNSATPVQAGFQAPHAPGSHAHAAKGSDGSLNNTLNDNLPILIGAAVAGATLLGALTALLVMYVQKRRRGSTRKHQLLIKSQRSSSGVDFCNLDSSPSTAQTALLPSPFGTSPGKGTSASAWLAHACGHEESCCAMCVRSGRSGKAALFSALAGGESRSLAHGPYRKLARSHSSPSLELRLVQSSSGSSSRSSDGNQSTSGEPDLYPPSSHHSSQTAVSACSQGSKRTSVGSQCSPSKGSCSGSTATVKRDGRTSKNRVAAALDEAASSPSGICTVSSSSISDINTGRDAGGGGGQPGSCTLHPLPQGSRLEIWAHAISDGDQSSSTPSCSNSRDVVIPLSSAVALTRVLSYDKNEVANASVSSHQDPRMPQHIGEGAFVGSSSNSELTPAVSRWPMHMHSVFADAPSCLLQSGSIRVDAHTDSDTASGWGTPTLHGACSAAAPAGFLPGPALSLDRASSLLNQRRASTSRLALKGTSAAGAAAGADGTEDAGSAQAAADVGISKQSLLYAASTSGHAAMTSATAMLGSAFQHEQAMSLDLLKWSSGIPSQLLASVWGTSSEIAGAMIQHALMDSSGIAAGNTGSGPDSTRASLSTVATAAVVSDVCGPFQQGQRLVAANTVGDAVCVGDMSMAGKEMQAGGDARLGRSCLSVPAEGLTTALASQQKG